MQAYQFPMKKLNTILLLLITILVSTTCKKYSEGGWSNVAIKHLFGGTQSAAEKTWKLKLYEVNGIDSTFFISPGNGVTHFENETITFGISNARAHDYDFVMKVYGSGFSFDKQKKSIEFTTIGNTCKNGICERSIFYPETNLSYGNWSILKLTKHEFILSNIGTNHYKIIFIY